MGLQRPTMLLYGFTMFSRLLAIEDAVVVSGAVELPDKTLFARALVTLLENPSGGLKRFLAFEFFASSIEKAREISGMMDTIRFSKPSPLAHIIPGTTSYPGKTV